MQGGPERFFHSGFRQLLSGCQAKDKMGLCPGPAGGRRALGFVQDDRLTAAEMQEAGQFVRVGVARQPGGTAAHIQRQRWPGEEPARLTFAEERQRLRHRDPKAELSAAGTACSLLHSPIDLSVETRLDAEVKSWFAFALQKCGELALLRDALNSGDTAAIVEWSAPIQARRHSTRVHNAAVEKRLAAITAQDSQRANAYPVRAEAQRARFNLPAWPTTTIGSFPQTTEIRGLRLDFKKGNLDAGNYRTGIAEHIKQAIAEQERLGLDVLVHGEAERNDMVEYFGESLGGFLFTKFGWVQSYGTRCVKPPIIWGDVYRDKPITVDWSVFAQSQTDKIMKGMLTGPVTILNWSFPREDISIEESMMQIAFVIRDEVLDLEKNGIRMIQIDEAALREKLPLRKSDWYSEYLDFAIPAFRLTHSGVKPETQIHTHMCYSEFNDIIKAIDDMDADVITFEASRSDLQILDALRDNHFETEVGPGVYDIHSARVPSVEEIVTALKGMLEKIEPDKLWVNPDCGLKTRGVKETDASLRNMVAAAKEIRRLAN